MLVAVEHVACAVVVAFDAANMTVELVPVDAVGVLQDFVDKLVDFH